MRRSRFEDGGESNVPCGVFVSETANNFFGESHDAACVEAQLIKSVVPRASLSIPRVKPSR